MASDGKPPFRLMQFDSPRTTCQLFYKLWHIHPQLAWGRSYHGFNGYQLYGPDRLPLKLRHKNESVKDVYYEKWVKPYEEDPDVQKLYPPVLQDVQQKFVRDVESSEADGKIFFGKEHILDLLKQDLVLSVLRQDEGASLPRPTENPTFIPDDLLKTLTPLFVIRHPLHIIDSSWRGLAQVTPGQVPEDEDFEFKTTLKWTKLLYDYFKDELGVEGLIVDSEDVIRDARAVTDEVCAAYGLDPDGVQTEWDPVPEQYWPKSEVARTFVGHLMASKGVEKGERPKSTDVGEQVRKWTETYGEEVAGGLHKRVEEEMPVYAYLKARKLQV